MNKKAYLKTYRLQQAKLNRLKEMLTRFPENENGYQEQIRECHEIRKNIEKAINSLKNEVQKEILTQKYICGKTNEEIGLILNYSTRHIERLHRTAIENIKI